MQVNKINQTNTNFKAVKDIKFLRGFKNDSYIQTRLLDAFESNKEIQRFCEYFDTTVFFDTFKSLNNLNSRMVLLFKEPLRKGASLFEKIKHYFKSPEEIRVNSWDTAFDNTETSKNLAKEIQQANGTFDYYLGISREKNNNDNIVKVVKNKNLEDYEAKQKEVSERIKKLTNKQ